MHVLEPVRTSTLPTPLRLTHPERARSKPPAAPKKGEAPPAPPLGPRELPESASRALAALGIHGPEDLATVDAMGLGALIAGLPCTEVAAVSALWAALQVYAPSPSCAPCLLPRRDGLPRLAVTALAGQFEPRQSRPQTRGPDPLILQLQGIHPAPGTVVKLRNASDLDAGWIELPFDATKIGPGGAHTVVLDDAWMRTHDVRPGDVLELVQTRADGSGASAGAIAYTNRGLRAQAFASPDLRHATLVGDVRPDVMFRPLLDGRLPQIALPRLEQVYAGGRLTLRTRRDEDGLPKPFTEPGARVELENLSTGEKQIARVGDDGALDASILAGPHDAIVMTVSDHSAGPEPRPDVARKITLTPTQRFPVLNRNPSLGIEGRPAVRLDGLDLCAKKAERAVTPGAIVTLHDTTTGQRVRTVADREGSFAFPGLDVRRDDVIELEASSPFEARPPCLTRLRLIAGADGGVDDAPGPGFERADPQARISEVGLEDDPVLVHELPLRLTGLRAKLDTYHWSTNALQLEGELLGVPGGSGRGTTRGLEVRLDVERRSLTVTLHTGIRGGWFEPTTAPPAVRYDASFPRSVGDRQPGALPNEAGSLARMSDGPLSIRVVDPEGKLLATATAALRHERHASGTYTHLVADAFENLARTTTA